MPPDLDRRTFIKSAAGATVAGAVAASVPIGTRVAHAAPPARSGSVSGSVSLPQGFTVPAGQTLTFDPNRSTTVTVGANVIVEGRLVMKPASGVIHRLVFTGVNENAFQGGGMDPLDSDVGLWVMGAGVLDLVGKDVVPWNRSGWDKSWSDTDQVRLAPTAPGSRSFSAFRRGDSVPVVPMPFPSPIGTRFMDTRGHIFEGAIDRLAAAGITEGCGPGRFCPDGNVTRGQMAAFLSRALKLPPAPPAGDEVRAEVLNLTRSVRIEGTPAGRAHIFIRSSKRQTLRFVEIKHMGPRQAASEFTEDVLGRYGLHFHHCHDGSRGSLVEGVVITQCGSHAFVPHISHGITFRGCISFDTTESAYWWDLNDPTDDLVWDRCVAALVRAVPEFRGFRLAGFTLGRGQNVTAVDCVAVGVLGTTEAAGFNWPEPVGGGIEGVWTFRRNISHNNNVNGIFTWQNTNRIHRVEDFLCYHNGQAGIDHGAYINPYVYSNGVLHGNPAGVILHATSHGGQPAAFENIRVSNADVGFRAVEPVIDGSPVVVRNPSFNDVGKRYEIDYSSPPHDIEDRFTIIGG